MAKQFIFVNTDGDYEQGGNTYEVSDFINISSGVADAGKPIVLDSNGVIATSMIDLDALGLSVEWQDSVIDADILDPSALTPSDGDRYLINGTGAGDWSGHDNEIAEYIGSSWEFTSPITGMFVSADDESDIVYYYGGSSWSSKSFANYSGGDGIDITSNTISVDLLTSGGLKLDTGELGIEPGDFAGEGIIDDGSDNLAIDWSITFNDSKAIKASDLSSTLSGLGASIIGIEDSNGNTDETNVEGAIAELYSKISGFGVEYTVGTGGVAAGDLVYISGNNTVVAYDDISTRETVIGVAATTQNASETVKVLGNDTLITGVLTGATAGTTYYWTGSGWTTNFSSFASGEYIWIGGVAKNATDVHVEIEFIMRKA